MYLADHLSRAYLSHQGGHSHDEFQVFALELEEINPLDTVKITNERLAQLQKAAEQDPVMQTLKSTILMGWPDTRDHRRLVSSVGRASVCCAGGRGFEP